MADRIQKPSKRYIMDVKDEKIYNKEKRLETSQNEK